MENSNALKMPPPVVGDGEATSPTNLVLLMIALMTATASFQLNASMLSPVLVTIARQLQIDEAAVSLSQTVFFTSAALLTLFIPRLSDILGRKKVLVVCLSLMVIGAAIGSAAQDIVTLSIARAIQGFSGPAIPLCLLMLRHEVKEPKKYGTMMGVITAFNGGVAGVDTILGGALAAAFGFRPVFYVIVGFGIFATFAVMRWANESKPSAGVKMDWTGTAFLVITVAALLIALQQASHIGQVNWTLVIGLAVAAAIAFIIFWQVQGRVDQPLVATKYMRERSAWALLLTTMLSMAGIYAAIQGLMTSYAQNADVGFGMRADTVALGLLAPSALLGLFIGPIVGRIAETRGYCQVLRLGLIGNVVWLAFLIHVGMRSPTLLIISALLLGICSTGITNIMLNGLSVVLSPRDNLGFLPGMTSGAFHLGAGISFAVLPAVMAISTHDGSGATTGYVNAFHVGLVITVLSLLSSFLISNPKKSTH